MLCDIKVKGKGSAVKQHGCNKKFNHFVKWKSVSPGKVRPTLEVYENRVVSNAHNISGAFQHRINTKQHYYNSSYPLRGSESIWGLQSINSQEVN